MPSSAAGPPSVPGLRIERRVAVGGFGVVYEAVRESDGLRVALKVARRDRPGAEESLAREVEVLTRVGPPHVPAVLLQGTTPGGAPYLAMEYVEAPTLAERLDGRSAEPSPAQAGALAVAILVALERVHAHGYVHRDLKPENVFAHDDGRVVLVDFGLAAPASDPLDQARVEGAGTAEYMAPEQCEGAPGVDARADLYAVGVMLFELLTGRPPFWGSRADVKESHRSLRPPRASALAEGRAVPAAVDEVVARALSKDPAERWGGAAEMRAALEAALLDDTVTTPAEQGGQREGRGAIGPEGERTTAGLVFFETHLELASLKAAIEALGGHVGDIAGERCVAVFPAGAGDDPARRARRAAEELLRLGACARARVDLAKVGVRRRRDGTRRFIGGIFTSDERFPASGARLQISPAAAEVLGPSEGAAGPPADSSTTELSPSPRGLDAAFEPLVGRDALVAELLESARRAATDGAPTVARIVAEPGLGKSHLARVLAERLAATFAGVLALRAREPALGDVDRALADLLTWALDLPAAPPRDGGEALLAERLGPADHKAFSPAVALALGWIDAERPPISTGEPSPLAAALRAQGAAPGALRATLTVAAGAALRRRAERAPLFVILDDAHHAGDVLIDALELAALAEARAPLWIAILGRPVLERRRPEVGQRAARCERFELAPLDGESAAALCRRLLLPVESAPDAAVQRLVSRAQGSPLLLVELVRGLHREGMVRPSPEGESFYLATDDLDRLPESPLIEWLARRELDALDPALRAHAHLLALLGEQVSLPEIEGLLRRLAARGADDELPLDARIGNRRLLAARVIVKDGAGRVTFRHALVREAVASAVPPELGRRVHAAAAELYATAAPGVDEERRLAQLAYHAGEAGLLAEAARSSLALAERARARHAYTDAERLYSRALLRDAEAPRSGGLPALERRVARRGRGLMRYRTGRYHDALADLAEAREMAASTGDRAEQVAVLLDEATVLDWAGEFRESAARVEEARALLPVGGSPSLSARLLLGLGRSAFRESRNEEAAALLASAARTAEPLGDEAYETRVIALFQLGFLLSGLGRAEEARWALDESVILAEEHGDRLHLGSALNVRGTLWGNLGDERRLVEDLERSLGIARELGQVSLELMGEFNLAEFLLYLDAPAAAEPHLIRAKALDRRLSGDAGLAAVALLEARLLLQRGDDAAAAGIVAGLRARQRGASAGDGALLVPSDEVLCVMVELLVGGADAAAWEALEARAAGSVAQERLEVLEARGEAAARQGRLDEARASFERALALARRAPNAMERRLARRLAAVSPPRRP